MHHVTAIGGGSQHMGSQQTGSQQTGSQQTGSQQSKGAQQRLKRPKQPASASVGAANDSMATAMHPVINPRKVFICLSHVERWKSINSSYLC